MYHVLHRCCYFLQHTRLDARYNGYNFLSLSFLFFKARRTFAVSPWKQGHAWPILSASSITMALNSASSLSTEAVRGMKTTSSRGESVRVLVKAYSAVLSKDD